MTILTRSRLHLTAAILTVASLVAGWWLADYILDYNIGINADSIKYLNFAEDISQHGLSYLLHEGLIHYPSLYPLVVSLFHNTPGNILPDAIMVNQLLFGVNLALLCSMCYYVTRSIVATAVCTLLALSSPVLIQIHAYALSEPLFLFFTLLSLWLLATYLREGTTQKYLYLSCIPIALSIYTRYAGLPLILVGWVAILIRNRFILNFKLIKRAIPFTLLSLALLLFSLTRNTIIFDNTVNRTLGFYPVGWSKISWLLDTVAAWFSTVPPAGYLALFLFIAIAGWYILRIKDRIGAGLLTSYDSLITILAGFAVSYTIFIYFSATFVDPHIPFDNRIFSPLYLVLILIMGLLVKHIWNKAPISVQALYLLTVAVTLTTVPSTISTVQDFHTNSGGYNEKSIIESELMVWLEQNHHNYTLYSNYFDLINFHLDAQARPLGYADEYKGNSTEFLKTARSKPSAFVYFKSFGYRPYFLEPAQLQDLFDTKTIHEDKEGTLLITE